LRGLKLHPRSERWIDNINSTKTVNVLIEAAKHSMPVIFDTRGRGSILDIAELVKSTRSAIEQLDPKLLPHFKVIIAHFAQGNIGDYEVYNAIVQPNTYGDLSMLHGEGAGNFLEDFRKWFRANNKFTVDKRDWSEYILYASDYPYFGDIHAEKLLIYIINKRFFDTGGSIRDVKNILGLNQIRILPEYNLPLINKQKNSIPGTLISHPSNTHTSKELAINGLAKLIANNRIDIKSFCLQFKESWYNFNDDVILNSMNLNNKQEIPILLTELVKDKISLFAPLTNIIKWQKFGYKYFSPQDRAFFASVFKQCYLSNDEPQIVNYFNQIFN